MIRRSIEGITLVPEPSDSATTDGATLVCTASEEAAGGPVSPSVASLSLSRWGRSSRSSVLRDGTDRGRTSSQGGSGDSVQFPESSGNAVIKISPLFMLDRLLPEHLLMLTGEAGIGVMERVLGLRGLVILALHENRYE